MTVTTENRKAGPYIGNGTVGPYPFAFKVFEPKDVVVFFGSGQGEIPTESKLIYGVDYTVSLNSEQDTSPGGIVNLTAPLATGMRIILTSQVPYLQETELTNFGKFYPTTLNDVHDRAVVLCQQLLETVQRSLKVPLTSDIPAEDFLQNYLDVVNQKIAEAAASAKDSADSAVESSEFADHSGNSAQAASNSEQKIADVYLEAMNALKNITGFASATQVFHGLRVGDDMRLYWDKSENDDVMQTSDYGYTTVLPVEARFYLISGELMLELPFTQ